MVRQKDHSSRLRLAKLGNVSSCDRVTFFWIEKGKIAVSFRTAQRQSHGTLYSCKLPICFQKAINWEIIIQLLPSELKCLIAKLLVSSESPKSLNSLAALARTHTAYQREAEKELYDTLYICASSDDSLKCMETLAKNSEKAALVRFMTIKYVHDNTKKNRRVTSYLSKSLIYMHRLSDFRVKSCAGGVEAQLIMGLGKILWSVCKILIFSKLKRFYWRYSEGHFRLKTFYCPDVLNISRIIKSQTELQTLGLYTRRFRLSHDSPPRNILKNLKELHDAKLFLPIVLLSDSRSFSTIPDHISIFPAFYSAKRRATVPQVVALSFGKDLENNMVDRDIADSIVELSIYLIDSADIPSIYTLAKDMAASFPRIGWLNLWFERRCEIVSFLLTVNDYNRILSKWYYCYVLF